MVGAMLNFVGVIANISKIFVVTLGEWYSTKGMRTPECTCRHLWGYKKASYIYQNETQELLEP
jgi:hypothetical protein